MMVDTKKECLPSFFCVKIEKKKGAERNGKTKGWNKQKSQ